MFAADYHLLKWAQKKMRFLELMEIPPLHQPPQNKLKDFLLSDSTAGSLATAA